MEELHAADDQSHYEISLTAGQAFVAFVLLLLSLAAAFAFGLMIGKGQADERLVVQKETPVVTEASLAPAKKSASEGKIVELPVENSDFAPAETTESTPPATEATEPAAATASVVEEAPAPTETTAPAATPQSAAPRVTTYAQLLSTSDQKTAESLAAKLIDRGFTAAYVERGATDKGATYRVRVKFDSEEAARGAESKLKEFSKEVWITTK
ncbi:MAG TPA: SPOR domain-containing protein [Thermoanaerobaculia bacterium]|nr:SPOR domain-containing protein [Thermoanaerobaculia bacterium]